MASPPKSFQLSPEIHDYLVAHGTPIDDVRRRLVERTEGLGPIARMQVAPEQGALLTMLVALVGATRAVEVGTFTGYSALCIAAGLAPGGRLLCCDVSDEWTSVGRAAWAEAGLDDRIDLRIAPAAETLAALPTEPQSTSRSSTPTRAAISPTTRSSCRVCDRTVCSQWTTCCGAAASSTPMTARATPRRSGPSTTTPRRTRACRR